MNVAIRLAHLLFLIVSAFPLRAETVTDAKSEPGRAKYPCFSTLTTDAGTELIFQLSDYKSAWSLHAHVDNRADTYRRFFDDKNLRDMDELKRAFPEMRFADTSIRVQDWSFLVVQKKEVDDGTSVIFTVLEAHNVARVLAAMEGDRFEIPGLIAADGLRDGWGEFRSCAYEAMGLKPGDIVETDYRAEFRHIFEGAFSNWVSAMTRAEGCRQGRFDQAQVDAVLEEGASAFFPGLFNLTARKRWREDMGRQVPMMKLTGQIEAMGRKCMMSGSLAQMSRLPLDKAIEAARGVD